MCIKNAPNDAVTSPRAATPKLRRSMGMTSGNIQKSSGSAKPVKPYPDFPLSAHSSGKWCKKVRGKIYYFGSWSDPVGALNEWLEHQDSIRAGAGKKRSDDDAYDIGWLVNAFLDSKEQQREQGDLSHRAFNDYFAACTRVAEFFGKGRLLKSIDAPDFKRFRAAFPATWGPTTVNNEIARVSAVFKFAYDVGAVPIPIQKGPNFKRVSKKKQRLHRACQPKKEFTAAELHQLAEAADVQLRAMILLGVNCGYGNADCGRLEIPMIDFERSWIEGLRDKTAIERAAWLWPETVTALKEAIDKRYENAPPSLSSRVFITVRRQSWFKEDGNADPIAAAFGKLRAKVLESPVVAELCESGMKEEEAQKEAKARWRGVGFYSLRHVFETVAGNSKDQIAVNHVMGHADVSMAAVYREGIDPERIISVCQHVRDWWLAGKPEEVAK